jgi:RHS repeat-associated protein
LTTSFTYDSEGRLTRTTRPDGKHSDSTYDYAGNRLTFADEKERMTEYFYDNESRLIRVEAPAQAPVDYVYDDAGNMLYIEVNDDEYRRTDYAYDKLNRRTSETFPQGYNNQRNVRYYSYDATNNVGAYRDGRDVLTVFGRDGAGRVISKVYEVPENRPEIREVPDVGYAYDDNGNLTGISNSDGAASWSYDSLDRLETEQVGNGPQITYAYDPRGVILSETVTGQSKLSADHEYDAVGRRIKTTQDGQETEFTWDGALRRTKVTLPSGEYTVYAYDNVDRQEDIYYRKADDTLFEHYAYTYDDVGNPTALETMNGDYSYGYDTAYRLTSESRTGFKPYSISHVYDLMGNRTQRTTNNVVRTFSYNKADQITGWTETATDRTAEYVYDADGNTIQKLVCEDNDLIDQWDYEFDSVGRMNTGTQSEGGTQSIVNVYAGDQWYRVSENLNGTTRKYGWRRDELFAEFNASNELTAGYLNDGVDRPLFKTRFEDDGETVAARDFYHQDANLRVHHVTDADGDVSEKYVYTGYGERKILDSSDNDLSASAIGNRIGFQGREHEDLSGPAQEHGLTFHRNRFYDPDVGRFTERDFLDSTLPNELYEFVGNAALKWVDPYGLERKCTTHRLDYNHPREEFKTPWLPIGFAGMKGQLRFDFTKRFTGQYKECCCGEAGKYEREGIASITGHSEASLLIGWHWDFSDRYNVLNAELTFAGRIYISGGIKGQLAYKYDECKDIGSLRGTVGGTFMFGGELMAEGKARGGVFTWFGRRGISVSGALGLRGELEIMFDMECNEKDCSLFPRPFKLSAVAYWRINAWRFSYRNEFRGESQFDIKTRIGFPSPIRLLK